MVLVIGLASELAFCLAWLQGSGCGMRCPFQKGLKIHVLIFMPPEINPTVRSKATCTAQLPVIRSNTTEELHTAHKAAR